MKIIAVLWLSWCVVQTIGYLYHWQSDLTLWAHAVEEASWKPRPALNYAGALLIAGETQRGVEMLVRARRLADLPHVPPWDRALTQQLTMENLIAIARAGTGSR